MKSLLVTLADKNYIEQAKQLFSSVYFNAGWDGDYMLLSHEIPENELRWFRDKGILIKKCIPLYDGKLASGYPVTILDKFYLFTPEFKKWDNVIFLDADIIVRYSLKKLSKVKGFWAVSDKVNCFLKNQFNIGAYPNYTISEISKNFDMNTRAFNTGVIAYSTEIIKEDTFKLLMELFYKYEPVCNYGEQPIINLYFYKKWEGLNFLYNFSIPYRIKHYHLKPKIINGAIIHFIGNEKPWGPNNPFHKEWKENLNKANYIDLKNKKKQNIHVLRKNKILYLCVYFYIIKIYFDFYYFVDKLIGLIGIFLNKEYPKLYYKLKMLVKK